MLLASPVIYLNRISNSPAIAVALELSNSAVSESAGYLEACAVADISLLARDITVTLTTRDISATGILCVSCVAVGCILILNVD